MKARLSELINDGPARQWVSRVKKDPVVVAWIDQQTDDLPNDAPFPLRAYCALSGERPACPRGSLRKLRDVFYGFTFCAAASTCLCAKEAVSSSVSATKSKDTVEKKAETQWKREQSNLVKYGHRNSAQTEEAKAAHAAFYQDADNVASAQAKLRSTMLQKHGVENAFHTEKALASRLVPHSLESRARGAAKRVAHARAGGLLEKSYPKLLVRMNEIGFDFLTQFTDYTGLYGHQHYEFRCHRCKDVFSDYLFGSHDPTCPRCDPVQRCVQNPSKEELTLHAFVDTLGLAPIYNSKRYIKPLELDILLLDQKIAIEYTGEYYHHDDAVGRENKHYHLQKLNRCLENGWQLITIFSDEWLKRRDACEIRLRHILGRPLFRTFGRKLKVAEIDATQGSAFLERYHTQGNLRKAVCYFGLFKEHELVSVMSFGPTRAENNADDIGIEGHWELYRFASSGTIVGGASKLFQAFVKRFRPKQVTSFCDRRWGEGQVYPKMGFVHQRTSAPAEWWFKNGKRTHRWSLRKDKLVAMGHDPNKTAEAILKELKYRCVYDCGTHKFVFINTQP